VVRSAGLELGLVLPSLSGQARRSRRVKLVVVSLVAVLVTACANNSSEAPCSSSVPGSVSTTQILRTTLRPAGSVADLTRRIRGGRGTFMGTATNKNLNASGCVQHEYCASETVSSYRTTIGLPGDGRSTVVSDSAAPFRTRVVIRRPVDRSRSSGTVVVEGLTVSDRRDADPEYASLRAEILRRSDAWVGVSAQKIGVGPVAGHAARCVEGGRKGVGGRRPGPLRVTRASRRR
jgi:hypothetical protein